MSSHERRLERSAEALRRAGQSPGTGQDPDWGDEDTRAAPGPVVFYRCSATENSRSHEIASKLAVARALAGLMGRQFSGEFESGHPYPVSPYFVPSETLVLTTQAQRLGIHGEQHLFGGVVPFAFVATKAITHPVPDADSPAPTGWSPRFAEHVSDVVLPGFSAFSRRDAMRAGLQLLDAGAVRIKQPNGVGGLGQSVARNRRELESGLDAVDASELARDGIVLERNLVKVETCSVGQARVDSMLITYCGTQRLTRANDGSQVYGGSDLTVVRGGWSRLLALELAPALRTAIGQARVYHDAAMAMFQGMFASRCNYDIAQGVDDTGNWRSGVLEQSWRIGGASAAEVAALHAFHSDGGLEVVQACTTEIYGEAPAIPEDALVYFRGDDEQAGPITKFSRLQADGHS